MSSTLVDRCSGDSFFLWEKDCAALLIMPYCGEFDLRIP